ncbi:hypothetical protein B7P43_G11214 [Cryptotermes secundus]|uniref:Mos1 transposase HTH domain-containing protein n=1 Tax=Cryptotermes secundus TaxID=105785 RepID=A0A2J7R0Z3_9NEOP|nr:hypothetical protein B7P43_G11214 [Cryptotermes secundus]
MTEQYEQRYCIEFCQKLGDIQVETICRIQQAFRDDAMSNSWIKEWYNRFKDGRTSVDSEPRSGRPSTSQNENVMEQSVCKIRTETAHLIQTFVAKHNIPVVHQAPYSPNMALCDFWLFPKLKMLLKGTQFESREDIMWNATARLITIPKDAFQKCFQQWWKRWEKCVHYHGDYFEGD